MEIYSQFFKLSNDRSIERSVEWMNINESDTVYNVFFLQWISIIPTVWWIVHRIKEYSKNYNKHLSIFMNVIIFLKTYCTRVNSSISLKSKNEIDIF